LRTPLCGILGSTDVLRDHGLDSMALALVEQVNACGRTLLDIIDSLLDFANLKSQRLKQGSVNSTNVGRMLVGRRNSSQGDDTDVDMSIALDDLTEEVTESTVFSYFCQKSLVAGEEFA
jgi:signal transduction histidine kinase